jgi:hypothetical protein
MESANPDLRHPTAKFAEPLPYGYVYVGMTVDPPGRAPFVRRSARRALEAWESLTGWYTTKTGVDNSTLLQPIGEAPYAFVNYVRLPRGPVRFMLDQLIRPSFHTFVRTKLRANGMVALPLLCEAI